MEQASTSLAAYLASYGIPGARLGDPATASARRYAIAAADGQYELCVVPAASAQLRLAVADHVAMSGFRRVQRPLQNLYQQRTLSLTEDTVMYVTRDWPEAGLSVSPVDVRRAAENLAQLHRALAGGAVSVAAELVSGRERYGTWERQFRQGAGAFARERVHLLAIPEGADRRLRLDWLSRWEELAERATERLAASGYADFAARAREQREVAWNGYRLGTLCSLRDGRVATRLTADPVFDDSLYDLASLCREIAEAGHADGVRDAIDWYSQIRPLAPEQVWLVQSFAAYPHQALMQLRSWRKAGQGEVSEALAEAPWRRPAELQFSAAEELLAGT
jgi:hypothetical protein